MQIIKAQREHLAEIVSIYNWAITHTAATFDTEVKTVETQTPWFEKHNGDFVLFVAIANGKVQGWAGVAPWSDRCAYDGTGEVAIYVDPDTHGKGIGSELLKKVIDWGAEKKFRTLISKITSTSGHSLYLHKKMGFESIGVMKNVGRKFDQILDVELLQYLYPIK